MSLYFRHEFRAMGTGVSLIGPPPAAPQDRTEAELTAWAMEAVFAEIEARFSRFRADSELCRVNARAGRLTKVSRPFADLLAWSLESALATGGMFDPTLLEALIAAGYDRDYAEIRSGGVVIREPPPAGGRWREIEVEERMVKLPEEVRLDFGGVAKGWAVDRATEVAVGLPWAVVNAGGDLRVTGTPPNPGVEVGVDDPADPSRHILQLWLEKGALATSSVLSRTWGPGLHQLIDPRTSRPAATGVVQATVWAPTCAEAEVRSKWAMLAGPAVLDRIPGVLVMEDGRIMMNLMQRETLGHEDLQEMPA
jgi:thiamine biosynthesis lipoprotein